MPEQDGEEIRRIVREEMGGRARLPFPLDIDTLQALKKGGLFLYGSVTLSSGTASVVNQRIQTSSIPLVGYKTHSNQGALRAAAAQGSITITSSSGTDGSEVWYLILL